MKSLSTICFCLSLSTQAQHRISMIDICVDLEMDNNRWNISRIWECSNRISTGENFSSGNEIGSCLIWSPRRINGMDVEDEFEKIFGR
jgi:hypothetical protein